MGVYVKDSKINQNKTSKAASVREHEWKHTHRHTQTEKENNLQPKTQKEYLNKHDKIKSSLSKSTTVIALEEIMALCLFHPVWNCKTACRISEMFQPRMWRRSADCTTNEIHWNLHLSKSFATTPSRDKWSRSPEQIINFPEMSYVSFSCICVSTRRDGCHYWNKSITAVRYQNIWRDWKVTFIFLVRRNNFIIRMHPNLPNQQGQHNVFVLKIFLH